MSDLKSLLAASALALLISTSAIAGALSQKISEDYYD